MSYSFHVLFKHVKKEEVLSVMQTCAQMLQADMENHFQRVELWMPSRRSDKATRNEDIAWALSMFELNFVYWKDKELLGLQDSLYPLELYDLFDAEIHFQDSQEQDYPYEEWSENVPYFKEKVEKWKNSSLDEVCETYKKDGYDVYSRESVEKKLEFHRQSCLYHDIVRSLQLLYWVYGGPCEAFVRFQINAINSYDLKIKLEEIVPHVKRETKEEKLDYLQEVLRDAQAVNQKLAIAIKKLKGETL